MKVSETKAKRLAKEFNINLKVVPLKIFMYALNEELEHGSKISDLTNITDDDLDLTTRIVLAHLIELPDYYQRLKKMDKEAKQYWKKYKKPDVFL
jgi:Protein of unknown function (DUF5661)